MNVIQIINTWIGVAFMAASIYFFYSKKTEAWVLPFISILFQSAYFEIHFAICGTNQNMVFTLTYIYQILYPLSAILFVSYPKKSISILMLSILITITSHIIWNQFFGFIRFESGKFIFAFIGFLTVLFFAIKMLRNLKNTSAIHLFYFLTASFFLLVTLSLGAWNRLFHFDPQSWLTFIWFYVLYNIIIKVSLLLYLVKHVRH